MIHDLMKHTYYYIILMGWLNTCKALHYHFNCSVLFNITFKVAIFKKKKNHNFVVTNV